MVKIIGVRFRNVGKIYYFNPKNFQIKTGDAVIVETARGVEFGRVVLGPKEVEDSKVVQPLKDVIRVATKKDQEKEENNRKKEKEAYEICLKKIQKHDLDMKLIDAEYTFDNNKVLFYFTADGRIDFRELVKDLAAVFNISQTKQQSFSNIWAVTLYHQIKINEGGKNSGKVKTCKSKSENSREGCGRLQEN